MQNPVVFSEDKRYVFNNWSSDDFIGRWDGVETVIKAGTSRELPEYLAYNFCKHFVDREMQKEKKEAWLSVEVQRAPYEEKTIAEIGAGTDSPALSSLTEKIRAEIEGEMKAHDVNLPTEVVEKEGTEKEVREFDAITT